MTGVQTCALPICDLGPGHSGYVLKALNETSLAIILMNPARDWERNFRFILEMVKTRNIPWAVVINKYRDEDRFLREVSSFCKSESVPLLGIIPFSPELDSEKSCNFHDSNSKMEPIFAEIWERVWG